MFWLYPDQEEITTAALDLAKKAVSTQYETVALEAICQAYMATGIAFKKWEDALSYYAKHAADKAEFAGEVVALLETLIPECSVNVSTATKDKAQSPT